MLWLCPAPGRQITKIFKIHYFLQHLIPLVAPPNRHHLAHGTKVLGKPSANLPRCDVKILVSVLDKFDLAGWSLVPVLASMTLVLCFSYGFPMVFLCFSYGFPMAFLWLSYGFPMVFQWVAYGFPYGFPMVSYDFLMIYL